MELRRWKHTQFTTNKYLFDRKRHREATYDDSTNIFAIDFYYEILGEADNKKTEHKQKKLLRELLKPQGITIYILNTRKQRGKKENLLQIEYYCYLPDKPSPAVMKEIEYILSDYEEL